MLALPAALAAERVDFVDEDDGRAEAARHVKEAADLAAAAAVAEAVAAAVATGAADAWDGEPHMVK